MSVPELKLGLGLPQHEKKEEGAAAAPVAESNGLCCLVCQLWRRCLSLSLGGGWGEVEQRVRRLEQHSERLASTTTT